MWQHEGVYYAIGTDDAEANGQVEKVGQQKVFPLLRSKDFVTWQLTGNALIRPDAALVDNYWAPEVAYCNSIFYLYYSVGFGDKQHQLRVATSDHPLGSYERDLPGLNKTLISG